MTVRVDVLDEVDSGIPPEAVEAVVRAVMAAEGAEGVLCVAFVDEATIADLNERYRGCDGPTDVLSFLEPGDESWPSASPGESAEEAAREETDAAHDLGELAVCTVVVGRYASEEGNPHEHQLAWTLVHGTLHLLGYDHEVDAGEMREREEALLAANAGLIAGLRPAGHPETDDLSSSAS